MSKTRSMAKATIMSNSAEERDSSADLRVDFEPHVVETALRSQAHFSLIRTRTTPGPDTKSLKLSSEVPRSLA